jgi:hypothetical protein
MTGTIRLSIDDSVRMRQNLLFNMTENDRAMEKYFDSLAEGMVIHSDGVNTTVEFEDLDLSDLDTLIEKNIALITGNSKNNTEYISCTKPASYSHENEDLDKFAKTIYAKLSDILSEKCNYAKTNEKIMVKSFNSTIAA